jgi:hypothetical protein
VKRTTRPCKKNITTNTKRVITPMQKNSTNAKEMLLGEWQIFNKA